MNITNKFLLYACAAATLMTAGCSDELRTERDDGGDKPVEENYLRLTLHCPDVKAPLTRSNPTGGENGDGYEPGQDYETRIDDLMLLSKMIRAACDDVKAMRTYLGIGEVEHEK